jgi:hypothetical protein
VEEKTTEIWKPNQSNRCHFVHGRRELYASVKSIVIINNIRRR